MIHHGKFYKNFMNFPSYMYVEKAAKTMLVRKIRTFNVMRLTIGQPAAAKNSSAQITIVFKQIKIISCFDSELNTFSRGVPQPDNREGDEFCLAVLNNFYNDGVKFHDVSCHHLKPTICEA